MSTRESGLQEQEFSEHLDRSVWKRLLAFTKPYRWLMLQLCLFNLVLALGETAFPLLTRYAIDRFAHVGMEASMTTYLTLTIGLSVLLALCTFLFIRHAGKIEQFVSYDIRKACFRRLQELSFSYYDKTPVGYIMARMTSDTMKLSETIAWALVDILWSLARMVGAIAAMLYLSPSITLWVLLVIPPLAVATIYFQRRIFRCQRKVRRTNSRITGAFNESIMGAVTTKSLVREEQNLDEFSQITQTMYRASRKAAHYNAIFFPTVLCLGSIGTALALWKGGVLVLQGVIWFGTISAFASYATQFFEPMQQLARIFSEMQMAQASAERVFTLLDTPADITDTPEVVRRDGDSFSPNRAHWPRIRGDVDFDHVTFAYQTDTPVLHDFDFHVKAGQTIALVGQTGSGKSTIVNLLCRFYEPTQGCIRIDGVDTREHSQLWLQSHLGYVLQTPHLFSGTIADNIRYGRHDASDEAVVHAAQLVSADAFIRQLPYGYETQVGEGGNRLSTGQKQLISFARAILNDPPLFVLDEATSSIDTETEQLIQAAITRTLQNRTSFIIAHRLSTIRSADCILVLKHGRVVEKGTHEQLLAYNGYYASLHRNQLLEQQEQALFQTK